MAMDCPMPEGYEDDIVRRVGGVDPGTGRWLRRHGGAVHPLEEALGLLWHNHLGHRQGSRAPNR
jgi:hypothetical protein